MTLRRPVPDHLFHQVNVPGAPVTARIRGDLSSGRAFGVRQQVIQANRGQFEAARKEGTPPVFLAISGGGADGAFGAGLLNGWSEAGDRPRFLMVTGVSTGAMSAPLAFLGSEYDGPLREIYTLYATKDLIHKRPVWLALFGDALAAPTGLQKVIARYIDRSMLKAFALQHERGRRCWVGTTDLDTMLPVYWNLGEIAAADEPGALELIRSVLLASASIPGAFPPIRLRVEAAGEAFDELHVDGGAASQLFVYPLEFNMRLVLSSLGFESEAAKVYVIRNARLTPRRQIVRPRLLPILERAIDSMIRTQGLGDLHRIHLGAQRDGFEFNLAHIPDDFTAIPRESFDLVYMRDLFELGRSLAKGGYRWLKAPPDYAVAAESD
jgi:predicted acylesterase/phospholipase RssA